MVKEIKNANGRVVARIHGEIDVNIIARFFLKCHAPPKQQIAVSTNDRTK